MTKYDSGGLLSSFLYTGVLTETEAESLGIRPGTGPPCDDCFKAQDFLNLDSQLLRISSGYDFFFLNLALVQVILFNHSHRCRLWILPPNNQRNQLHRCFRQCSLSPMFPSCPLPFFLPLSSFRLLIQTGK